MDRHLYKAVRGDNKEWIQGDLLNYSIIDPFKYIAKGIGYEVADPEIGKPIKIYPHTLCQCTGLLDKNQKFGFENDEVLEAITKRKYIIKWHDNGWNLYRPCNKRFHHLFDLEEYELTGKNFYDQEG